MKQLFLSVILLTTFLSVQSLSIEEVLQEVTKNNLDLKYYSQQKNLSAQNVKEDFALSALELNSLYLPFTNIPSGSYREFEVSQSFAFPSVYNKRNKWTASHNELLDADFRLFKQNILITAKNLCIELIYLNKKIAVYEGRIKNYNEVFIKNEKAFNEGLINQLELQKSHIAFINETAEKTLIETTKKHLINKLTALNGGVSINIDQKEFTKQLAIIEKDSMWATIEQNHPTIKKSQALENQSVAAYQLSKQMQLPKINAGYNYQGSGNNYNHGPVIGLSIPLWKNSSKQQSTKIILEQTKILGQSKMIQLKEAFNNSYETYISITKQLVTLKDAVNKIHAKKMLHSAYENGHLSFISYYQELDYYYKIEDTLLDLEKEQQLARSSLLKPML